MAFLLGLQFPHDLPNTVFLKDLGENTAHQEALSNQDQLRLMPLQAYSSIAILARLLLNYTFL